MMSGGHTIRDVRRIDKRPATIPEDCGSVMVSMGTVAALLTQEVRLIRSVRFIAVSTLLARARAIRSIDGQDNDAGQFRLVLDKGADLCKGPGMESVALVPPSLDPRANVFEVFKHNRPFRAFSERDNLLANSMIFVFGKAPLFACELFEAALGRFGSLLLESGAKPFMAVANALYSRATVALAVRISGNVGDTKIDAQELLHFCRGLFDRIHNRCEVKRSLMQNQVRLALPRLEQSLLTFAADKRDMYPSVQRPDGYFGLVKIPAQNSVIVSNRAEWLKRALLYLI